MKKIKCRWHPRRNAVVLGCGTRLGYCRECWPSNRRVPPKLDPFNQGVIPFDATIWLAA
jgi:hypothetical protein